MLIAEALATADTVGAGDEACAFRGVGTGATQPAARDARRSSAPIRATPTLTSTCFARGNERIEAITLGALAMLDRWGYPRCGGSDPADVAGSGSQVRAAPGPEGDGTTAIARGCQVQLAQPTDQEVALRTTDDIEQLAGMAQQAEMPATDLEKLLRSPRPLEG